MRKSITIAFFTSCLAVCAANAAAPESSTDQTSDEQKFSLQKTGEVRRCVPYDKITRYEVVASDTWLFTVGDKFYLNKTLSECVIQPGEKAFANFVLATGNVCRNTIMRFYEKGNARGAPPQCTLGEFSEVKPIPVN